MTGGGLRRLTVLQVSTTSSIAFRVRRISFVPASPANFLWSRPGHTLASIHDSPTAVLRPHVLVPADVNTDAIAIMNVVGCDHRVGRALSRPCVRLRSRRVAINPLQINDFVGSTEHARVWLAARSRVQPNGTMPLRGGQRDCDAERAAIDYVRLRHRRADVGMTQQLLHRPNWYPSSSRWGANKCRSASSHCP